MSRKNILDGHQEKRKFGQLTYPNEQQAGKRDAERKFRAIGMVNIGDCMCYERTSTIGMGAEKKSDTGTR
jgi:hypothetical protein